MLKGRPYVNRLLYQKPFYLEMSDLFYIKIKAIPEQKGIEINQREQPL